MSGATTALVALTKGAIEGFAEYEQLTGGVETLFKSSADTVMGYAENAYKTAGLSANEYMETVTSFSASLLQSLGGDTEAAAKYADQAITDMSDNANKMGTDMSMIQTAYQGFAKQNYTMLDNLKLGYGGTKEEMERLLADAQAISGVEYDVSSYADVVEAIHVIQEEMGIAGTTAKEASQTISGSIGAMKSAWQNLVVGIANGDADLGGLINNFVDSVATVGKNVIPVVKTAVSGISELVTSMAPIISEMLPMVISTVLPALLEAGTQLVGGIAEGLTAALPAVVDGLITAIPMLIAVIPTIISAIITTLTSALPQILQMGVQILGMLASGIENGLPAMVAKLPVIFTNFVKFISTNLPTVLAQGAAILTALVNGIIEAIPELLAALPEVIDAMLSYYTETLPDMVSMGIELLISLVSGIISAIPQLLAQAPAIITQLVSALITAAPSLLKSGVEIITQVVGGIDSVIGQILTAGGEIIGKAASGIAGAMSQIWQAGVNIVNSIISGISSAWASLTSWFSGIWSSLFGNLNVNVGVNTTIKKPNAGGSIMGSHASGLDYVPFDGYIAELHEGEMVLTANQARNYRDGSDNPITIVVQSILDGKIIGESSYEYIKDRERAYGRA